MTEKMPENDIVERLREFSNESTPNDYMDHDGNAFVLLEAADKIEKLRGELADYKDAYEDTKRLARLIDVALCGEEGAAKQASLCDLVSIARSMSRELAELKSANEWRPIDGTQKDGDRRIVSSDKSNIVIAVWRDSFGKWMLPAGQCATATYWKPLPKGPSDED